MSNEQTHSLRSDPSTSDESRPTVMLEKITKHYRTDNGGFLEVLRGIDLEVQRGDTVAIVGPSGSGKSTLLNIIGTLDNPSSGRLLVDGVDPTTLNEKALSRLRSRKIGFVFQLHHLLPQCTVLENILIPALATGDAGSASVLERAEHLLQRVGLTNRRAARPGELSGGERQRVAVVRALINRPVVLLADEPTGSLDRNTACALTDLLLDINREENVALILVTHSQAIAARMRHVFDLQDGKLVRIPTG